MSSRTASKFVIAAATKMGAETISVADNHLFVVCRDGGFYDLPGDVRKLGPWQGMHSGDIARLNPDYWLDLEEQGYALVRCDLAVFRPEA